ncbi:uncharacterized protein SOCE26_014810 [Sorangium cellulosum]|uniref:Uncharacterized protein n=1 Tax=Sorangium cellulosum TaxID=56 RepID=A0A2L0ELB5_SORCE|nr:uncharacterized protein SOCE26_014810 [Sorangium cellulosum]
MPLGRGEGVGRLGEHGAQGHGARRHPARAGRLVGGGVGRGGDRDGGEHRVAYGAREPRVALLGRGGDERERHPGPGGGEQARGVGDVHPEPSRLGRAGHEPVQDGLAITHHRRVGCGGRVAVDEGVHGGVGEPEGHVEVPPAPQLLDRVVGALAGGLLAHVLGERLAGDRVEQPPHVAELPVDGGRLHPGGGAHRPGGHRLPPTAGQQIGRRPQDALPHVHGPLGHVSDDNIPLWVRARAIPREQWEASLAAQGMPPGFIRPFVEMEDVYNAGWIAFGVPGSHDDGAGDCAVPAQARRSPVGVQGLRSPGPAPASAPPLPAPGLPGRRRRPGVAAAAPQRFPERLRDHAVRAVTATHHEQLHDAGLELRHLQAHELARRERVGGHVLGQPAPAHAREDDVLLRRNVRDGPAQAALQHVQGR